MHGSDLCAAHAGRSGARPKPGVYSEKGAAPSVDRPLPTINGVIRDLAEEQRRLTEYVEEKWGDLSAKEIAALLGLHGPNAARLGRLLRERRALEGESADGIANAIGAILDEISLEVREEL